MSTYRDSLDTEAQGMRDVLPFIGERAENGQFVVTNKGRLSAELQTKYGDVFMNKPGGEIVSVELKTERDWTGNLFIETWSNMPVKKGWFHTLDADFLLYYFLDVRTLYVMEFKRLREYLFPRLDRFREREQRKCRQLNRTWGRLVPVTQLVRHAGAREYTLKEDGTWLRKTDGADQLPLFPHDVD